jgi:GT2 family glycosyltransferase
VDLSIIIVNWNSAAFLNKCLSSIFAQTIGIQFEVVVIDCASFDGCADMLRRHFPAVRLIQSDTNLGFARANNRASLEATGSSFLFLNPDTEVVGSAISTLHCALASQPRVGMLGGRLLNSDGSVQTSCIQSRPTIFNKLLDSNFLRAKWPTCSLWGMRPLFDLNLNPAEVDAVSGACFMIKSSVFRQVGGFSEDYFMYAEDIDLAEKVRNAGYANYYIPRAVVVHHGSNSTGHAPNAFAAVMMPEATWRFFRKTRGQTYATVFRVGMCGMAVLRLVVLAIAAAFGGSRAATEASISKWRETVRWSLKRDALVHKYYSEPERRLG